MDPLPVNVLTQMGVKKIIAVNVLCGSKDRIARNRVQKEIRRRHIRRLETRNFLSRWLGKLFYKVSDRYADNIFNVIMSTIQFMEYEIAEAWGSQADVYIHAVCPEGHWAEFYSPEKFIRVGEEKTIEQLDEIKRLIVE